MRLEAHGLAVDVPRGWDARISRRAESEATGPAAPGTGADVVPTSGYTAPVLHLANFALPDGRGDYGSGAVGTMRAGDVFVALLEFGPEAVGTALFAPRGLPRLRAGDLTEAALQRPVAGLAGAQRFFTDGGRAFCLYAVVGSVVRRSTLVTLVNGAVGRIRVAPR